MRSINKSLTKKSSGQFKAPFKLHADLGVRCQYRLQGNYEKFE